MKVTDNTCEQIHCLHFTRKQNPLYLTTINVPRHIQVPGKPIYRFSDSDAMQYIKNVCLSTNQV